MREFSSNLGRKEDTLANKMATSTKKTVNIYFIRLGSYSCMNMLLNVTWSFKIILPDGSSR